jgi:hypothetical protein
MIKIEALLKEKSFSELTELEQLFVLKRMSVEDYEAEHQIVLLSEKLKDNQAYLTPNSAIKAELMGKMRAKNASSRVFTMPYRMAAGLLFCFGIFYFLIKNNKNDLIQKTEINAQIKAVDRSQLAQIDVVKNELKPIKLIKNKRIKKPILINKKYNEEEALLMSFNRKNPNLAWQEEDEEVINSEQSKLQCNFN